MALLFRLQNWFHGSLLSTFPRASEGLMPKCKERDGTSPAESKKIFHISIWRYIPIHPSMLSKRSAFSLVEVMICLALIADLVIIAMPAYQRSRRHAQNSR